MLPTPMSIAMVIRTRTIIRPAPNTDRYKRPGWGHVNDWCWSIYNRSRGIDHRGGSRINNRSRLHNRLSRLGNHSGCLLTIGRRCRGRCLHHSLLNHRLLVNHSRLLRRHIYGTRRFADQRPVNWRSRVQSPNQQASSDNSRQHFTCGRPLPIARISVLETSARHCCHRQT